MPEAIQTTGGEEEEQQEEIDTDAEFKALYAESQEGENRLKGLAVTARAAGKADIGDVYDEVRGTVMSLLSDFIASTGGALTSLEDAVAEQEEETSRLLPEDAEKYLLLFAQFDKLLEELAGAVSSSSDGDAQREIFATLQRLTTGLAEFTREITIGGAGDDEEEDDEEEDAAPDSE